MNLLTLALNNRAVAQREEQTVPVERAMKLHIRVYAHPIIDDAMVIQARTPSKVFGHHLDYSLFNVSKHADWYSLLRQHQAKNNPDMPNASELLDNAIVRKCLVFK